MQSCYDLRRRVDRRQAARPARRGAGVRAGGVLGRRGLQPVATATTVRVRDGERAAHRRPVRGDASEQLGGFYLVECKDLDEAIELGRARSRAPRPAASRCGR